MQITRRSALKWSTAALFGAAIETPRAWADRKPITDRMTLGFSTYGMKSFTVERALEVTAEIGFEAVEICVRPDWDSAPGKLSTDRRLAIKNILAKTGLRLTALMEHLYPAVTADEHKQHLERLKGVFELARALGGDQPPVLQTVLGDGTWDEKKKLYVDRVGDWVKLGREMGVVTCVKPHRGGAMSQPSEAVWLIKQLDQTPWVRMVYDYSHYAFRDIPLESSLTEALPFIGHVAVKDTLIKDGKAVFVLPGEAGTIDYATIFKRLKTGGYKGDLSCEVSGMVSTKPGYDPNVAAKICHQNLLPIFRANVLDRT